MKKWLYLFLVLVATLNGQIKIKPVDSYGLKKVGRNTYVSESLIPLVSLI